MILYFSGTGNSEYAARRIAKQINDTAVNLFEKIRDRDYAGLYSDRPWVIVAPVYSWRIPRLVHEWLENTRLTGNRDIYFVLTCGGSIGNAGKYLEKLCAAKKLQYKGCAEIIMPDNYIVMSYTSTQQEAEKLVRKAEPAIDKTAGLIAAGGAFPQPAVTVQNRVCSGIVNDLFYAVYIQHKKFYSTNACISCGKCVLLCPLNNIQMQQGKPQWGTQCTHCMACICRCPKEAVEYGKKTKGLARYTCPADAPDDAG